MGWTICVLLALLIGSLSVSWATLKEIPNIISIALGLSSLVLAVIAIVQTLAGNGTLIQSLGKIESAADRALLATDAVSEAAETLSTRASILDMVPNRLTILDEKVSKISAANAFGAPHSNSQKSPASRVIVNEDRVFSKSIVGFNVAMYTALRSMEHSKAFNSSSMFPSNLYLAGMIHSFTVGLHSLDIISIEYDGGSVLVKDIGPFTSSKIISMMDSNARDTPGAKEIKDTVDSFFVEKS